MIRVYGLLIVGFFALPTGAAAQEIVRSAHFVEFDGPALVERAPAVGVAPTAVGRLCHGGFLECDPSRSARGGASRIEPRYPLMGMLIGAVAGGTVAAMRKSTMDGPVPYPAIAVWYVSAGALTGLALGLYIGAKAEK